MNILSKKLKILAGGFDENGNPLYLIKDTTDMNRDMIGNYEICKKVIEQQSTIDKQKIIIEERDVANERLNRFLIEIGLEKEYIKWEFKKRCVE